MTLVRAEAVKNTKIVAGKNSRYNLISLLNIHKTNY